MLMQNSDRAAIVGFGPIPDQTVKPVARNVAIGNPHDADDINSLSRKKGKC
jgi:hypothetical protein